MYFYHPDHLGSSSYISNKQGDIIQHTEYMAFGEVLFDEHSVSTMMPYLFNGKELDSETGLYYYGARYYDPRTSIWLNVDPLVEKTGTPYAYVYNNPVMLVDPTGMEPDRIFNVTMEDGSVVQQEIDDGVNEIVDIMEYDYNWLMFTYEQGVTVGEDGTEIKDLTAYNDYYKSLGLGTIGYQVALFARGLEGSTEYAFDVKKGDFPAGTDKCNKFVYDVLRQNGAIDKYPVGAPPRAGNYADPKYKVKGGVNVVDLSNNKPRLGDVVAGAHNYAGSTASGHVEIITYILPDGRFWTTGATGSTVQTRTKGYDMLNGKEFQDRAGSFKYSPVTIRRPQ